MFVILDQKRERNTLRLKLATGTMVFVAIQESNRSQRNEMKTSEYSTAMFCIAVEIVPFQHIDKNKRFKNFIPRTQCWHGNNSQIYKKK